MYIGFEQKCEMCAVKLQIKLKCVNDILHVYIQKIKTGTFFYFVYFLNKTGVHVRKGIRVLNVRINPFCSISIRLTFYSRPAGYQWILCGSELHQML